jgi:hypothetical protein
VIAERLNRFQRELRVINLSFLQTDKVRFIALYNRLKLMQTSADTIDIEAYEMHADP